MMNTMQEPLLELVSSLKQKSRLERPEAEAELESFPFSSLRVVEESIHELLASWQNPRQVVQRRRWHRVRFNKMIFLVPLDDRTEEFVGEPRLVAGKDISLGGICFAHQRPLPHSKVAVAFEAPDGISELIVTRLSWCRFTSRGEYQSGGKFLRQIPRGEREAQIRWASLPPG